MAKVKTEVVISGPNLFQVHIDEVELVFDAQGKATIQLSNSEFHLIRWFVMGKKGEAYSIAITKPSFIGFSHSDTLDKDKKDAGQQWFSVKR